MSTDPETAKVMAEMAARICLKAAAEKHARVWCPVCGQDAEWKQGVTFAEHSYWRCGTCELAAAPETWAELMRLKHADNEFDHAGLLHDTPDIQAALRGGEK